MLFFLIFQYFHNRSQIGVLLKDWKFKFDERMLVRCQEIIRIKIKFLEKFCFVLDFNININKGLTSSPHHQRNEYFNRNNFQYHQDTVD